MSNVQMLESVAASFVAAYYNAFAAGQAAVSLYHGTTSVTHYQRHGAVGTLLPATVEGITRHVGFPLRQITIEHMEVASGAAKHTLSLHVEGVFVGDTGREAFRQVFELRQTQPQTFAIFSDVLTQRTPAATASTAAVNWSETPPMFQEAPTPLPDGIEPLPSATQTKPPSTSPQEVPQSSAPPTNYAAALRMGAAAPAKGGPALVVHAGGEPAKEATKPATAPQKAKDGDRKPRQPGTQKDKEKDKEGAGNKSKRGGGKPAAPQQRSEAKKTKTGGKA